ncbi:putative UDP-rhamnose:rhamnosyltransferase 1 [Platanthera guangdongensis]|uniref:UDP-rhamnose:rhamnosyltransferase 1 n=1 Tax=Platanthera guangdongensis TaxID=2320717 RepID=A0ABR2LX67_9ASPA
MGERRYHILMVPWLAFGHLLPFLQLAKSLAGNGHRISFLTTPRNIARLIPSVPDPLSHLIDFIEFRLPRVKHLPENAEATIDLPSDELRPYLRKAFDSMEHKLLDLIRDREASASADIIIYDYAACWVPPIAAKFGVPCAFFGLHNAAAFTFFGPPSSLMGAEGARTKAEDFTVKPAWIPFPSSLAYRSFEARELFNPAVLPDASGISESHRFGKSIQGCQIALIRSCNELESEWLQLLGTLYAKPIVPVGLLPPADSIKKESIPAIDRWLDEQSPGSVVYAAFGSEAKLTAAQMEEISAGLELSEMPFLWAVNNSSGSSVPAGLVERIEGYGRGRIVVGWVPQARILAHRSVGGFLTHGGWGSIVEGLTLGRVMVVLPMMFDQGLNARNLVEKGIGVEVRRREDDGRFTGEGIAESLRLAMVEEEGEAFRTKAREYGNVLGDEDLHSACVKQLISTLRIMLG